MSIDLSNFLALPFEIIIHAATVDPFLWRALLLYREFGLWSLTMAAREASEVFCKMINQIDCIEYYKCKLIHRTNGPARIVKEKEGILGSLYYYQNGLLHRDNGPAVICDEFKKWYVNGLLHRDNDKPAAEFANETQIWYSRGVVHRGNDKPAMIINKGYNTEYWYVNGYLRRDNGSPPIDSDTGYMESACGLLTETPCYPPDNWQHLSSDKIMYEIPEIKWLNDESDDERYEIYTENEEKEMRRIMEKVDESMDDDLDELDELNCEWTDEKDEEDQTDEEDTTAAREELRRWAENRFRMD